MTPLLVPLPKFKLSVVPDKITVKENSAFQLRCQFRVPLQYQKFIQQHPLLKDTVRIGLFNKKGWIRDIYTKLTLAEMINTKEIALTVTPILPTGKYYLRFAINCGDYQNPTHNSDKLLLVVD